MTAGKKTAKKQQPHSAARQPIVEKEKKAPASKSKGVQEKRKTSSDREGKGKGKGKGKNDVGDGNDDDDDNDNDQLKKKRKQSDPDNIDDYLKYYSHLKPSSTLLKKAELDARAAQLLFAETSVPNSN